MSDRRGLFKNADRDTDKMRRLRNDNSVEIRKVKKDDNLQKRRNIQMDDLSDSSPVKDNKTVNVLSIKDTCKMMKCQVLSEKLEAVVSCRKQLSKAKNPPIEQFFINGAIPTLVDIMGTSKDETLLFESAWALTNIASGESRHTLAVVQAGAVPIFMGLMANGSDLVAEQSMWALANIAGDSDDCRNLVVKQGISKIIIKSFRRFWNNITIVRQLSWLISNICRHKGDHYPVQAIVDLFPIMKELMSANSDNLMNADLTWGLSYATDCDPRIIDAVIAHNLFPYIIANFSKSDNVVMPSIRLLGNIVAGTDEQCDAALHAGVIQAIAPLLANASSKMVKECCWLISNISAGTEEQVMAVVHSGIVLSVLDVMNNGDYKSQKESVFVISNMTSSKSDEPKLYLLNNNVFASIVKLLNCDDNKVVIQLMESITVLLELSETYNQLEECIQAFEAVGGIDIIEELQNHSSDDVYNMSYELVKQFFGAEDDEEKAGDNNIQQFAF